MTNKFNFNMQQTSQKILNRYSNIQYIQSQHISFLPAVRNMNAIENSISIVMQYINKHKVLTSTARKFITATQRFYENIQYFTQSQIELLKLAFTKAACCPEQLDLISISITIFATVVFKVQRETSQILEHFLFFQFLSLYDNDENESPHYSFQFPALYFSHLLLLSTSKHYINLHGDVDVKLLLLSSIITAYEEDFRASFIIIIRQNERENTDILGNCNEFSEYFHFITDFLQLIHEYTNFQQNKPIVSILTPSEAIELLSYDRESYLEVLSRTRFFLYNIEEVSFYYKVFIYLLSFMLHKPNCDRLPKHVMWNTRTDKISLQMLFPEEETINLFSTRFPQNHKYFNIPENQPLIPFISKKQSIYYRDETHEISKRRYYYLLTRSTKN